MGRFITVVENFSQNCVLVLAPGRGTLSESIFGPIYESMAGSTVRQ